MRKNLLYALSLGCMLAAGGCHAGSHGYEYASPAFEKGKPPLSFCERRGSILGPGEPAKPGPATNLPDPEPTLAPIPPPESQQQGLPGA